MPDASLTWRQFHFRQLHCPGDISVSPGDLQFSDHPWVITVTWTAWEENIPLLLNMPDLEWYQGGITCTTVLQISCISLSEMIWSSCPWKDPVPFLGDHENAMRPNESLMARDAIRMTRRVGSEEDPGITWHCGSSGFIVLPETQRLGDNTVLYFNLIALW